MGQVSLDKMTICIHLFSVDRVYQKKFLKNLLTVLYLDNGAIFYTNLNPPCARDWRI